MLYSWKRFAHLGRRCPACLHACITVYVALVVLVSCDISINKYLFCMHDLVSLSYLCSLISGTSTGDSSGENRYSELLLKGSQFAFVLLNAPFLTQCNCLLRVWCRAKSKESFKGCGGCMHGCHAPGQFLIFYCLLT